MSNSIYSEGTPRGRRGLRNTLQWLDEIVICTSMCMRRFAREVAVTPIPLGCYHQQKQNVVWSVDYKLKHTSLIFSPVVWSLC